MNYTNRLEKSISANGDHRDEFARQIYCGCKLPLLWLQTTAADLAVHRSRQLSLLLCSKPLIMCS